MRSGGIIQRIPRDLSSLFRGVLRTLFLLLLARSPSYAVEPLGAISAVDPRAVEVGEEILREGGNAVDAGVGIALSLGYFYPQAGGLGGGGFALVLSGGTIYALDFRETAPRGVTLSAYFLPDGVPIPKATLYTGKAVATPGMPFGHPELIHRFGRLPWERVLEIVIRKGEEGVSVSERLHRDLQRFQKELTAFGDTQQIFYPDGNPLPPHSPFPGTAYTELLRTYARKGRDLFREGIVPRRIAEVVGEFGGFLSEEDLRSYRVRIRNPLRWKVWGYEFACMDLPSSGGFILSGATLLLNDLGFQPGKARRIPYRVAVSKILRILSLYRLEMGDPDFLPSTLPNLLKAEGRAPLLPLLHLHPPPLTDLVQSLFRGGGILAPEGGETTHISVVDHLGTALSMTITLNLPFGSGIYLREYGFFLNNELDDFALTPTNPNVYGLIQGRGNLLEPGKRPLSSMTPCLVMGKGKLLAIGSPGGPRIPSAVLEVLIKLLLFGEPPEKAISAPRIHHQGFPDLLFYEPSLPDEERVELEGEGFTLSAVPSIGEVYLAGWEGERKGRRFFAVADTKRGPGATGRVIYPRPKSRR